MKFLSFLGILASGLVIALLLAGANARFGIAEMVLGPRPYYANWPTPAPASTVPLGTPPAIARPSENFAVQRGDKADPVAYDPCRPITYVIRPDGAPDGSEGLIAEAVDAVTAATGLQFVYEGPTDEPPTVDREAVQKERYGDRWAPVAISWSDPSETPELEGSVAGVGGSMSVNIEDGPEIYVSGRLVLDAPEIARLIEARNGTDMARAVIMHELGHVVGLGHVEGPGQLMSTKLSPKVTKFQRGDLTGLALLGAGRCIPEI